MSVEKGTDGVLEHKLYKRRWFMLLLFSMYVFNSAIQWGQFVIISDRVVKYYGVSASQVDWTATVFTLAFVLLVIPSIYIIDLLGIRYTMILGASGICAGTWIKSFAVTPDRFPLIIIGQAFTASFSMLTFGLYGRFPAAWFAVHEISTAGVLSFFGDQIGASLAFLLPPIFVKQGTSEEIEKGLKVMNWAITGTTTTVLILIILFFQSKPKLPPCISQAKKDNMKNEPVWKVMKNVIKMKSVLVIMASYSLTCGPYIAVSTLLNELILINFSETGSVHAGNIGSLMMIAGTFSSFASGRFLDKTRKFKQVSIGATFGAAICMACFSICLKLNNIVYLYVLALLFGMFSSCFFVSGFQIGLEVTYPAPESISTAVLSLASQLGAFAITLAYGQGIRIFGDTISNVVLTVTYFVGAFMTLWMPTELKRSEAEKDTKEKELKEFL